MNKYLILLLVLISSLSVSFSATIDLTEYEYVSKISVDCDEYKGYVKAQVPQEYISKTNDVNSYFDGGDYFIDKGYSITNYLVQDYWYVGIIDDAQISDIENIYDRDKNSYMLFENDTAEFTFSNPQSTQINKITIKAIDSQINDVNLYTSSGQPISFILKQNNFDYELFFDKSYNSNEIEFKILFNNILKLSDISFYKKQEMNENTYVYFYLDNECKKEFSFYFGSFGVNHAGYTKHVNIPTEFPLNINTNPNTLYNVDFDNDSINNYDDNCLIISNKDQKDINYNKKGDVCEDSDSDSIVDAMDNCVDKYNRDQLDNDDDGIGNACDEEDDRFFEKNIVLVYIFTGLIAVLFIRLSFKMMMSDDKKKK